MFCMVQGDSWKYIDRGIEKFPFYISKKITKPNRVCELLKPILIMKLGTWHHKQYSPL